MEWRLALLYTVVMPFASVLIIGVGLIGCSIAAALKQLPSAPTVRGIDASEQVIKTALELGYLDAGALPQDRRIDGDGALTQDRRIDGDGALTQDRRIDADGCEAWLSKQTSQLIILAVSVSHAKEWFERIEASGYTGVITDVASTKGMLTTFAKQTLSHPELYIPGHPMAGSEAKGIEGARANLFQGAHWILCPDQDTDPEVFIQMHDFVTALGARSISLPREEHDGAMAIVSHVPHMVASALVQLAGKHAGVNQQIFRLAAGGFKDTTRIAAGSPELWSGIALDNHQAVAAGLQEIQQIIADFEKSITGRDATELTALLQNASQLRSEIPATWVPDSANLVEMRISMANHAGAIAQITGIAGKLGCNIQSISIDHINEETAILELILTDEGDIGRLSGELLMVGFDVSVRPLAP
ncbi:prephenate dehydrogenase [Actinomycetota bacterium]|nr:prephenate dehydrogenase [Actinomycetota bacterium]